MVILPARRCSWFYPFFLNRSHHAIPSPRYYPHTYLTHTPTRYAPTAHRIPHHYQHPRPHTPATRFLFIPWTRRRVQTVRFAPLRL